ncbi:hypothetical protein Bbelb_050660 [Branchiostoma belcheri]|nr:hypothetical protein Bbelb_050660 [Branchiostoma belcheri]
MSHSVKPQRTETNSQEITALRITQTTTLTALRISQTTTLTALRISQTTTLTALRISQTTTLTALRISQTTTLSALRISQTTTLTALRISQTTTLTALRISQTTTLTALRISRTTTLTLVKTYPPTKYHSRQSIQAFSSYREPTTTWKRKLKPLPFLVPARPSTWNGLPSKTTSTRETSTNWTGHGLMRSSRFVRGPPHRGPLLKIIGQAVAVSIANRGATFPFLSPPVFAYMTQAEPQQETWPAETLLPRFLPDGNVRRIVEELLKCSSQEALAAMLEEDTVFTVGGEQVEKTTGLDTLGHEFPHLNNEQASFEIKVAVTVQDEEGEAEEGDFMVEEHQYSPAEASSNDAVVLFPLKNGDEMRQGSKSWWTVRTLPGSASCRTPDTAGETVRSLRAKPLSTVQELKKQVKDSADIINAAKFQVIEEARIPPPLFSAARLISALTVEQARESNPAEMATSRATLNKAKAYGHHPLLGRMVLRALGPKEDEDIAKKLAAAHPLGPLE